MSIKINRKSFDINKDVIPDSLIFMLNAYYSGNLEKFSFWRRQFEEALKVDNSPSVIVPILISQNE